MWYGREKQPKLIWSFLDIPSQTQTNAVLSGSVPEPFQTNLVDFGFFPTPVLILEIRFVSAFAEKKF